MRFLGGFIGIQQTAQIRKKSIEFLTNTQNLRIKSKRKIFKYKTTIKLINRYKQENALINVYFTTVQLLGFQKWITKWSKTVFVQQDVEHIIKMEKYNIPRFNYSSNQTLPNFTVKTTDRVKSRNPNKMDRLQVIRSLRT